MSARKTYPTPQKGDVWEDMDNRVSPGLKRLTVLDIEGDRALVKRACTKTKIRLSRMRPNSRGFRLVERDGKPFKEDTC